MLTNDENPVRYRALHRAEYLQTDAAPDGLHDNWHWAVPSVFAALASDTATVPVPSLPGRDDPHSQSLGYWGALHYLLLYRLGWSNPGLGLRTWIDAGMPLEDAALRLVQAIWGRDGGLDSYVAWTISTPKTFLKAGATTPSPWGEPAPGPLEPHWREFLDRVMSRPSPGGQFDLAGGSDPLHLSGHPGEDSSPDPEARFKVVDQIGARAMFVTKAAGGWYHDLMQRAAVLPRRPHDWRIEVYVQSLGFLGTYRRSLRTGLMFSGRHRFHLYGNA